MKSKVLICQSGSLVAGGGWRGEESDDFSGTGNLAPHSGVTSRGTPGDAAVDIWHIMDQGAEAVRWR